MRHATPEEMILATQADYVKLNALGDKATPEDLAQKRFVYDTLCEMLCEYYGLPNPSHPELAIRYFYP